MGFVVVQNNFYALGLWRSSFCLRSKFLRSLKRDINSTYVIGWWWRWKKRSMQSAWHEVWQKQKLVVTAASAAVINIMPVMFQGKYLWFWLLEGGTH